MNNCEPVFYNLMLQFLIFYCSGALAMIHLSCRTIPLLSVSQPRYIWAIYLSLTLIGSHRQMCPCLRYMFSMVLSVGCECMVSLVHKAWFDDEFFVQPLVIYRRVLKKCHLSSGTGYPNFACLPGLWLILLHKSIARVIHPSMYAQDFFSTNWFTPYQLSTFQLTRFTLIETLRWHITIKPSQTYFVSKHRKRPTLCRTNATLDKRSQANHPAFPHHFYFYFIFYVKENFQASFGNRLLSCEHLGLFHINVGIIVMPGNLNSSVESSRQQHVPSSSIFGPLKGLSPYLLTRHQRIVRHKPPSA